MVVCVTDLVFKGWGVDRPEKNSVLTPKDLFGILNLYYMKKIANKNSLEENFGIPENRLVKIRKGEKRHRLYKLNEPMIRSDTYNKGIN